MELNTREGKVLRIRDRRDFLPAEKVQKPDRLLKETQRRGNFRPLSPIGITERIRNQILKFRVNVHRKPAFLFLIDLRKNFRRKSFRRRIGRLRGNLLSFQSFRLKKSGNRISTVVRQRPTSRFLKLIHNRIKTSYTVQFMQKRMLRTRLGLTKHGLLG